MEPSIRQGLWIVLLLAAIAGVFLLLSSIGEVVRLVVIAALLAYLMNPLVRALEGRDLGRVAATVIVFLGISLVVVGVVFFLLPLVVAQVRAIQDGLHLDGVVELLHEVEALLDGKLAFLGLAEVNLFETLRTRVVAYGQNALAYVPNLVSLVGDALVVPFVLFFMLKDGRAIKKGFIAAVPNRYFEFALNVLHKMDLQLGNYLRGQLLSAFVVGVLSVAALWVLEVDYYLIIGVFAGLMNVIPYLGPVVGGGVAAVVSLLTTGALTDIFFVVLAFASIQLVDNTVMQPLVLARNVKLHPVVILLAILIGGKLFGFLGLLLGVPVAAVVKVVVQEVGGTLRRYRFD